MAEYQFWLLLFTIFFTNAFNKDITNHPIGNTVTYAGIGYCLAQIAVAIMLK